MYIVENSNCIPYIHHGKAGRQKQIYLGSCKFVQDQIIPDHTIITQSTANTWLEKKWKGIVLHNKIQEK